MSKMLQQVVPARRGITDTEGGGDLTIEATLFQVADGSVALGGGAQHVLKIAVGVLEYFKLALELLFALVIGRSTFFARYIHTCQLGQFFNGFRKVETVVFHQEAERVAACATTKAIIKLLVGADRK